jgi:hypothetical protein
MEAKISGTDQRKEVDLGEEGRLEKRFGVRYK